MKKNDSTHPTHNILKGLRLQMEAGKLARLSGPESRVHLVLLAHADYRTGALHPSLAHCHLCRYAKVAGHHCASGAGRKGIAKDGTAASQGRPGKRNHTQDSYR